jgi:hypothetical protein
MVSSSRGIHQCGYADMTRSVLPPGKVLELCMWDRWPFMRTCDWGMVRYALTEAPYWQIIETFWNTAMQQRNIWSIAFKAGTQEIWKDEW